ncbi:coenzyme A biosynthesis bifunctional protein CoaBC [mine drainage metagenome]|uniref:Coenzyme A biosynthesis bifunctional protein CoaBC n=1 Tax=mine drainage metagenome TaxID=410659 RepID=A0A1J5Q8Q6_9ZZZZ
MTVNDSRPLEIVVGVTGGIAAYKVCEVVRALRELGHGVTVVPTENSLKFVGAATWEALSGRKVATQLFESIDQVLHIGLADRADLVIVAPTTANFMARMVHGVADDLLTGTLLATSAPVIIFPAMHTAMWNNPATVANVETLRERGIRVVTPGVGRLTGKDFGVGRLPDLQVILDSSLALVHSKDLAGRRILISVGGTREAIDPVRYIGNRSSGRQGFALAAAAKARGAEVVVVAGVTEVDPPAGVTIVKVESALEMAEAIRRISADQDAIIMAAAVADFRPAERLAKKFKKGNRALEIHLVENPDILKSLVANRRKGQIVIGFAAETGDANGTVREHGLAKLAAKGADLLVINDVSGDRVFGGLNNGALIAAADGELVEIGYGSKDTLAHAVLDALVKRLT